MATYMTEQDLKDADSIANAIVEMVRDQRPPAAVAGIAKALAAVAHLAECGPVAPAKLLETYYRKLDEMKKREQMQIIVNGNLLRFFGSQIGYEEVVALAGEKGKPSVLYRGRSEGDSQRSGTMYPGCKAVEVEEGMRFEVVHTGNA